MQMSSVLQSVSVLQIGARKTYIVEHAVVEMSYQLQVASVPPNHHEAVNSIRTPL